MALEFETDEDRAAWVASMEAQLGLLEDRSDETGKRRAAEVRAELAANGVGGSRRTAVRGESRLRGAAAEKRGAE